MASATKFSVMVSLFNWMQKSKSSSVKRSKFRKFLDTFCRPNNADDYFAAIRLVLPALDRERGSYGLREHVLATCLIDAVGMSRDSPDAQRLLNWRKGGPKSGAFAGNFSLIAAEVLQRRQGLTSGGMTIKELNDLLDRLASSENRSEKTSILSDLMRKTNAQEMKWIIMIILKDLKLGISEKSIFHEFHPDAEDLFNVTCDLKLVCEKLRDRSQRHKRQDIEVGKAVRPQLALRVSNAATAWKKLHGKEVVVECKFDGDRIQIHKNGTQINFFSRNFLDHQEYEPGMSHIIRENVLVDRCILDGEMLVWDASANRFAEFGSNQEIAKAAKEGLASDRQLFYVAFDILYVGDTSVIHQSLKERHLLLKKVVKSVPGRLDILVPNGGLNLRRAEGEPCSLIVQDANGVERFFKETVENRDEGIILKDLNSKWEPSDRSGKWLKLKPDYIRAGSDLDVLIIGGYYGSGRRGGEVAQFLVGLAERSAPNTHPNRFVSFCRVGTGLSDEELDAVVTKLKPYLRKYDYRKKGPPSFYQVTNNAKERPDVWVESPEKSFIVSITSDIRTIRSEVFAAPYSLRFPRIDRVRYDKPWHECLDIQSFIELVHSSNGTMQKANDNALVQEDKPKRAKSSRGSKKNIAIVPSHFIQTDISKVKGETSIFSNLKFYFVNVPPFQSFDSLHKMVAENGGTFSMNINNSVTHCIAAENKGIKFQAAKHQGDVIHCSWFFDCCAQKTLLPLQPKYFLFLSDASKKKLEEEIDEFSDSYYLDLNVTDLKQIFNNMVKVADSQSVEHYKKKYSLREEWVRFLGCCIYFHIPRQFMKNMNHGALLELSMRRMKVEVCIGGGTVAQSLSHATHLVVICDSKISVDFDILLNSFSEVEKQLLARRRLHIVKSQWLEDCFEKDEKLPEDSYSLKPRDFQVSLPEDSDQADVSTDEHHISNIGSGEASSHLKDRSKARIPSDKLRVVSLPSNVEKRKRGRPSGTKTIRGKAAVSQSRRTRPRIGNKPAKICKNESDEDEFVDDKEEVGVSNIDHTVTQRTQVRGKGRSGFNQPRKTRAQTKCKPVEIGRNESEMVAASEGHAKEENIQGSRANAETSKTANLISFEFQKKEGEKNSTTEMGDAVEPVAATELSKHAQKFDEVESSKGSCSQKNDRDNADPVQAMLFNMFPILASQKVESENPSVYEDFKCRDSEPIRREEKLPLDEEPAPVVKKKKVSYKDVADELLKDW
ncbi:DNA ligase 4 [Andrographis paniculata]|uniref:DNA ligase 4 n=1 Tax=Andrographis paniculata TaxID=175694 RepID=UPI0021E8A953|nr:DNA ligase 4 [Andrographis paniculata]